MYSNIIEPQWPSLGYFRQERGIEYVLKIASYCRYISKVYKKKNNKKKQQNVLFPVPPNLPLNTLLRVRPRFLF